MIQAHTTDAWTLTPARATPAFRDVTILGGFAAPLFLWLAGLSVALSAERITMRAGNRAAVDAICRRGLEVFVLAFLFRLQAFIVSPGSHPVTLFRVDILNVMGPAIIIAGLAWGASRSTAVRVAIYAVLAAAGAMITPAIRETPIVDTLPTWIQWYLRPSGEHTTFTLFPWMGFVFAGGAVGALVAVADSRAERRLYSAFALSGAVLIAVGFYTATWPSLYHSSSFWTSSPTWFAIRTGVLVLALVGLQALDCVGERFGLRRLLAPLEALGRASLFIYWIHVELVYGYASWMIHRRLPLWGALTGTVLFSFAMYGALVVRDRVARSWQARSGDSNVLLAPSRS